MPIHRTFIQSGISQIGLWKIDESFNELYNSCAKKGFNLKDQENFKSELKRKQWLAARCLLGEMNPELQEIHYQKNGAPYTKEGIFISLSHSDEMVSVILDADKDVGIDIQRFTPKIKVIKHKFCSENELNFLKNTSLYENLHIVWSAKEAIYKMLKITGLIFKEQIMIKPFDLDKKGNIKAEVMLPNNVISIQLVYEIIDDYILAYTLNP